MSWECPRCQRQYSDEMRACVDDGTERDRRPEGYFLCGRGHRRSNPLMPCEECDPVEVRPTEHRGRR